MKKLLLITAIVLTAYLILMTTAAPHPAAPQADAADIMREEPPFLVTEHGGYVAVYRNGMLYRTTDTLVRNLPKSDANRLREGVRLNTEKELRSLLEDLCS